MKTSELTDPALDWAVCEASGFFAGYTQFRSGRAFLKVYGVARNSHLHPSTNWAQGGPIIERELIAMSPYLYTDDAWQATLATPDKHYCAYGPTPLTAAMRCFVSSKLGDEVEIPKELT